MKYGLSLRICQPLYTRYCRFSIKVDEVKSSYQDIRANVDANFCGNFQHAACLVKEVDKHMILRGARAAGRHRVAPAEDPEESYWRNTVIPFLDHIIIELDAQFSGTVCQENECVILFSQIYYVQLYSAFCLHYHRAFAYCCCVFTSDLFQSHWFDTIGN